MDMPDLAVHRTFGRKELRMYSAGIIVMGNPPPRKKHEGGAQNFFKFRHIPLDYDSEQALNLQWNRSNTFFELKRTNLPS